MDDTFGGRAFAYIRTDRPACCANNAEVRPSGPHPITPRVRSPGVAACAMRNACILEPQESDQPEPPCP
ncbi:hypothetical protein D3C79_693030 [compost metagenome]